MVFIIAFGGMVEQHFEAHTQLIWDDFAKFHSLLIWDSLLELAPKHIGNPHHSFTEYLDVLGPGAQPLKSNAVPLPQIYGLIGPPKSA